LGIVLPILISFPEFPVWISASRIVRFATEKAYDAGRELVPDEQLFGLANAKQAAGTLVTPDRAGSPRKLPMDHDYAVPTHEYQSDQPSPQPPRPLPSPLPTCWRNKKRVLLVERSFHMRDRRTGIQQHKGQADAETLSPQYIISGKASINGSESI
jgi:hypothetical protein